MQIRDDPTLAWPDKLKGDPNKRPRNKYCHFHHDYGHDTFDCYDLKAIDKRPHKENYNDL